jgi:hypothetical protein
VTLQLLMGIDGKFESLPTRRRRPVREVANEGAHVGAGEAGPPWFGCVAAMKFGMTMMLFVITLRNFVSGFAKEFAISDPKGRYG